MFVQIQMYSLFSHSHNLMRRQTDTIGEIRQI